MGGVAANDDGTDRERANRGNAPLEHRWLPALAAARRADGVADIVWVGDSISELNAMGAALPWQIGRILSGWTEATQ